MVDTAQAVYALDSTGTVALLNGVAQGADFNQRIGRKITMRSVQIRGLITPQDASVSSNLGRIMIIYDTQPNGALPAITDVLNVASSTSMMNLNNRDRFKILMDEQVGCGAVETGATLAYAQAPGVTSIQRWIRLNHDVVFDGTTAAIGDIQTGSLFILTVGFQAANAGHNCNASLRMRFVDN